MALKFLNKKGWHTGSLRNIENVWKAEQKKDAEDKKLDELRKQIHEERERSEFRLLQEKAGLVPRQERLDFLYDSGLAVGKTSDGFKALEALPKTDPDPIPSTASSSKEQPSAPGALFEEKPQSANDAWRKLHSDPLLLIRQREQDALARIKNNPVKMAMIKESVKGKKHKKHDEKEHKKKKKSRHSSSKRDDQTSEGEERKGRSHGSNSGNRQERPLRDGSDSETGSIERRDKNRSDRKSRHRRSDSEADSTERRDRKRFDRKPRYDRSDSKAESSERRDIKVSDHKPRHYRSDSEADSSERKLRTKSSNHKSKHYKSDSETESSQRYDRRKRTSYDQKSSIHDNDQKKSSNDINRVINETTKPDEQDWRRLRHKQRQAAPKLTEEERAAKLREMQMDAEIHEEQRWKRLKKASEDDALEEKRSSGGSKQHNFLDAAQKSIYGAEKGGSSTIEESVRRRSHFLQGRSDAIETNAFRR